MPQLLIKIKDKIAKPLNNCVICDNSDYTVKFIFDEEWEKEPLRIARFIWNKQYVDVQFTGDTCEVPVVSKTNNLAIGVYAGDLRTTTPAILTCYTSILSEDVIEHSVTPSEYEEIMKLLNAQATDIAALKAVDKKIWTNLDTINRTASAAKIKAEEGVAKADDALTATRTNATNITNLQTDVTDLINEKNIMGSRLTTAENTLNNVKTTAETAETKADNALTQANSNTTNINTLRTDVNALKSVDESIWTNLDTINRTASAAKIKAEEGVAKADSALARNIFTDEEKAKLANITNPMVIKGRVDTVNDLPTEAVIGWFYFVGLESASSYEEYCYSENGWEFVGLSQEGVDLSNYYTKAQVDSKEQTLIGDIQGNAAAIEILHKDVGDSVADIYSEINSVKNTISPLQDNMNVLIDEKNIMGSRLTTAENTLNNVKTTAETAETKADNALTQASSNTTSINSLRTDVKALDATDERIWTNLDTINKTASTAKTKAEEGVAKADNALTATRTNATNISTHETRLDSIDNTLSSHDTRITTAQQKANSVDEKVDATNKVVGQLSTSLQSAYNKINAHANDIALNRTALGTQCKNLLKNNAVTQTVSGVTFTINDDKSITVNGTATAQISFLISRKVGLGIGNYILTGCPSGGSQNTFYLTAYASSAWLKSPDFGSGCRIENKTVTHVVISIASGYTANNLKFYPMLRDADITDDTYEPYQPSLQEQINQLSDTSNSGKLLYNMSEVVSSPLTVNITGLFTAYTVVVCNVLTSNGKHSLTLPLKYIKSLGTSAFYEAENILFYYVDDNKIKIATGLGQNNPTINAVKIISLF